MTSALRGADLERALQRRRPKVVIVDCECESWSWREICCALRKLPNPPRLIACASRDDERLWAEVVASGGDELIARPFDRDIAWAVREASAKWDRCAQLRHTTG